MTRWRSLSGRLSRIGPVRFVGDVRQLRAAVVAAGSLLILGLVAGYAIHEPVAGTSGAEASPLYDFEDPTALDIALNNLVVMVALVAGVLTLGAITVSGLLYNGFVLGTVVKSLLHGGLPATDVVALIVPHALFELGGLVLAAGVALDVTTNVLLYLLESRETVLTRTELRRRVRLVVVATLSILLAAVIEVYVTPALA